MDQFGDSVVQRFATNQQDIQTLYDAVNGYQDDLETVEQAVIAQNQFIVSELEKMAPIDESSAGQLIGQMAELKDILSQLRTDMTVNQQALQDLQTRTSAMETTFNTIQKRQKSNTNKARNALNHVNKLRKQLKRKKVI